MSAFAKVLECLPRVNYEPCITFLPLRLLRNHIDSTFYVRIDFLAKKSATGEIYIILS